MNDLKITLKAARINAGLTQKEVAKKIGKSTQALVNWETGKNSISVKDASSLCKVYGVDMSNIFFDDTTH